MFDAVCVIDRRMVPNMDPEFLTVKTRHPYS